ncbi:TetR/AcrR family transcriptional regulator [Micromonosporaceae bacterium Da 78-11]
MVRKTQRRHDQGDLSRRRILEATVAVAAERGYDGTSISLVTESTGLPASSVYWHFKNKDELIAEALEYSYRSWRETAPAWTDQVDDDGDLDARIRRRLHRAATAVTRSPEFWRLGLMLALERRLIEPAARRRFLEVRRETREGIAQWWRQVLAPAGQFEEETAMRLARFQLSVMDGLYVGERASRVADRARLVDLIAAGMYARALGSRVAA